MINLRNIDDAVAYYNDCKVITEGWCSDQKATHLILLCEQFDVRRAFEIGVYGGLSYAAIFIGMVRNMQLRGYSDVSISGIDSWSKNPAIIGHDDASSAWWGNIDWTLIKNKFETMVDLKLRPLLSNPGDTTSLDCNIGSTTSNDFRSVLRSQAKFDLFHIDGNHMEVLALGDAALCVDCIHDGGVVILDDVGEFETQKAEEYLDIKLGYQRGFCKFLAPHISNKYAVYYKK